MIQTQENGEKSHFGPNSGPLGPNSRRQKKNFFSKMWLRESLDIMLNYHHVQYQKKTNNLILIKFSNGWADRQIDRRE